MSYYYSIRSKANLATCNPKLQKIFNEVIKHIDCSIICGHRDLAEQNLLYEQGVSQLKFPNSKHNSNPSRAVDVIPCPNDWDKKEWFEELAKIVKVVASCYNIRINWGGDWKNFVDMPHYELEEF